MFFSKQTRQYDLDPREQSDLRESVVVYLPGSHEEDYAPLAARLGKLCTRTQFGRYTGSEQEGAEIALYFSGEDANALFNALRPALLQEPQATGARIVLATGYQQTRTYTTIFLDTISSASQGEVPT